MNTIYFTAIDKKDAWGYYTITLETAEKIAKKLELKYGSSKIHKVDLNDYPELKDNLILVAKQYETEYNN